MIVTNRTFVTPSPLTDLPLLEAIERCPSAESLLVHAVAGSFLYNGVVNPEAFA
jgi:hypothetical protein